MRKWTTGVVITLGIAGVALPLLATWGPELRHYHAAIPDPPLAAARDFMQNKAPRTCGEFANTDLTGLSDLDPRSLDTAILELKDSRIVLPRLAPISFTPAFAAEDLSRDVSGQLLAASLVVPDLMVEAWRKSGDAQYLEQARAYVDGWWRFERSAWLPRGLQWNDHAVAARVFALTRYLCAMRGRPGFRETDVAKVLQMIAASGERLAKPDYFTFRTNHGVMQNIALMHIGASFPSLPQAKRFAEVGARRFGEQLDIYVSPEGAVNEHSAGYHGFGIKLLGLASLYFDALGIAAPPSLNERLVKARELYVSLRRPDETLPSLGDTVRGSKRDGSEGTIVARAPGTPRSHRTRRWVGRSSGLLVWWSKVSGVWASQTVVSWANFATQAHKHADEMSVFVWTDRSDILIGSGYWPYGAAHEAEAKGWAGANAPHFATEAPADRGQTRLVGLASSDQLEFAEMERTGRSGSHIRRQVLHLRPDRWIVIDAASGAATEDLVSTWTFDPGLTAVPRDTRTLALRSLSGPVAVVQFAGCANGSWRLLEGSETPFAGWTAADGRVVPAPAVVRRCPPAEPAVLILDTARTDLDASGHAQARFSAPDSWTIKLASDPEPIAARNGEEIRGYSALCQGACVPVAITAQTHSFDGAAQIDQSFERLGEKYTRYRDGWGRYRIKVSVALVSLWLGWLAVLAILGFALRGKAQAMTVMISAIAFAGWVGIALWVWLVYFR
jgi:hypothetical protein